MLGFQIRWDCTDGANLVIMAVTHWAYNFHTRKLPQSSFFYSQHQNTSIYTFQTQQLKGLPFFFSLINLHQPALFMEGHPWLSPPLLLSVISWTGVKVSFKPQALTAKWQLWHTAATSVHICIAKSSSIILHYLSLEFSCLSQLDPQREFFHLPVSLPAFASHANRWHMREHFWRAPAEAAFQNHYIHNGTTPGEQTKLIRGKM